MRRRLLMSMVTIVVAAVAVFGIPLAFVLDRVVHDEAQSRLDRDATRVAAELDKGDLVAQSPDLLVPALRRLVRSDDRVVVTYPDGKRITTGSREPDAMVATTAGPRGTSVSLFASVDDVDARVQRGLFVVVLVAVVALGGALALALVQSARLSAPLRRLAGAAGRLGDGDFSLATPRSGVDEIDAIAVALDQSAQRIGDLLRAERSFSAHTSHQLRSALTGLQLRIEELAGHEDPVVRSEATAALEQATRLQATVEELLALARTGRAGVVHDFDLCALVRQHVSDIEPLLDRAGRRVEIVGNGPVTVNAAVGAIGQLLDILLSNAQQHGAGTVRVRVGIDDQRAFVEITDEGKGIDGGDLDTLFASRAPNPSGHGIGLPLARRLADAEGATLQLLQARPPCFRVTMPVA